MKLISFARRTPMACGRSTVRPQPGITPTRVCVSPNFARSEAIEEVAVERELEAAGDGGAVDRADDRLLHQRERTVLAGRRCAAVGVAGAEVATRRAELLQVEARAERGIGAGEDDHVDVVAPVGLAKQLTAAGAAPRRTGRCARRDG